MSSTIDTQFAQLVAGLDYPVLIVTATHGGERSGCLVGFSSQVSIHPPRFLAGISVQNHTYPVAEQAETLIVHVVGRDQAPVAELFGGQTGDEVDKFAQVKWRPGPGGAPVLADLPNWFAGRVLERLALGDHVGFVLEPIQVQCGASQAALRFSQAKQIDPGHEA